MKNDPEMKRIVVGISGATGAVYGARLVRILASIGFVETHLVVSDNARIAIETECEENVGQILAAADYQYSNEDLAAAISSGSFTTDGMIVAPCSIRSLSGISYCRNDNLMTRAADVTLKERRPLVLLVRETPLNLGHLRAMTQATEMGAIVMPPVPAFYFRPQTIDDLVNHTLNRALDLLGVRLPRDTFTRWSGRPHS